MGCDGCATEKNGKSAGCGSNGACSSGSCDSHFAVFDWLSNMELPNGQNKFDAVEVRFKNGRKEFFRDTEDLNLQIGDIIATEASPGHDVGVVSLTGELIKVQMRKKNVDPYEKLNKVYRKASQRDIDVWQEARKREEKIKLRARKIALNLGLQMKISDVEFQGDASKATFYYTADHRVDFRQLIREFAREFKTRIEMRQIGLRQEASRLGGIGPCGRELCCSTWLTDFRSVSTKAARYQQLSLNPQKLTGLCGKLKCCLNYELDSYLEALQDFPKKDIKLNTKKGKAVCQKIDIFKGKVWYAYEGDWMNWHELTTKQAKTIINSAKTGKLEESLEKFSAELISDKENKTDFDNVVGQDSLTRFDKPKYKKRRKGRRKPRKRNQSQKNG